VLFRSAGTGLELVVGGRTVGLRRRVEQVRLKPANAAYPDQIYDDVRIQGKLIGVIRRLD